MVREPGKMEYRGMIDGPILPFLPFREARAVKTMVLGSVIPGVGRVVLKRARIDCALWWSNMLS